MGASERAELARVCCSKDWSKAIRILDSLLAQSCSIQDICNRAFCYSQLELHKHVVKDCDKALQIEPSCVQPYILKGHALSAMGKKEEALLTWRQGYFYAIKQSSDLKQLLELEELLVTAKEGDAFASVDGVNLTGIRKIKSSNPSEDVTCKSNGAHETDGKANEAFKFQTEKALNISINSPEVCISHEESNEGSNFSMKLLSKDSPKTRSISLDLRLSRGITKVNEGDYKDAIALFNQILRENPISPEALIGRGTAYAFRRELEAAIADFTLAIKSNPLAGEAWKRRGQARAALGELPEAIEDLTKALGFEVDSSDILHERGIVNFKFKDFKASVKDLSSCILRDKYNKSAFTYLGLALANLGEYNKAEEAHLKSIDLDRSFLDGWVHLAQFYRDMADHEKALKTLCDVLDINKRFSKAYYLRGMLYHGTGQHRDAVQDLSTALSIESPSPNIECLYYRASSYHAIGEFGDAIKDYDAVLELDPDSVEKFVIQCMAFYQKEIALYTASKVNSEFWVFDIDGDIDPLFKEYWCKRLHPKDVCEKVFRQTPLKESLKKGRLRQHEFTITKQKAILLQAADAIGRKIQYHCPGFLPNRRQYRMAGLAAIEIAQKVSRAWRALQAEWRSSNKTTNKSSKKAKRRDKISLSSQNRGGGGCSTSSPSDISASCSFSEEGLSVKSHLSWQDIYSIAVRWRQISEPCDPVVWVNKLSEEFNSGFGSNTPMLLGQSKVVRYYSNYERAFNIAKSIMQNRMYVNNAEDKIVDLSKSNKFVNLKRATSCSDLYDVAGGNFWVGTSCSSSASEGKQLEGTRITTQKMDERGFEFAIRTPCTPFRWKEYDAEMMAAWERLSNSYCCERYGSTDLEALGNVKDAILRMTYYWYNFMPLSRGSAVVGYVVMLGLFLAANMEVTADVPPGVQVDWEAILSSNPGAFLESIKKWLYPGLRVGTSLKDLPDVPATLPNTGSVIAALSNFYD